MIQFRVRWLKAGCNHCRQHLASWMPTVLITWVGWEIAITTKHVSWLQGLLFELWLILKSTRTSTRYGEGWCAHIDLDDVYWDRCNVSICWSFPDRMDFNGSLLVALKIEQGILFKSNSRYLIIKGKRKWVSSVRSNIHFHSFNKYLI